jgi:hypothetical protein
MAVERQSLLLLLLPSSSSAWLRTVKNPDSR